MVSCYLNNNNNDRGTSNTRLQGVTVQMGGAEGLAWVGGCVEKGVGLVFLICCTCFLQLDGPKGQFAVEQIKVVEAMEKELFGREFPYTFQVCPYKVCVSKCVSVTVCVCVSVSV